VPAGAPKAEIVGRTMASNASAKTILIWVILRDKSADLLNSTAREAAESADEKITSIPCVCDHAESTSQVYASAAVEWRGVQN
jgi:hypothetical protein